MRKFISGTGGDVTAAVRSYLTAHRQLSFADLYVIHTAPTYAGQYLDRTFLVTDYPAPLVWSARGYFAPAVIKRGGVSSKLGLDADTLDVTWSPQNSDILASDGSSNTLLTALQGFQSGIFDNGTLEVWRTVMPTIGDCDTLGACNLFTGRIGNVEADRLAAKLSVISRLETLNQQVPTNLIEPTNIWAQYNVGQVPPGGPSSFTIAAGTTVQKIFAAPGMAAATYDTGYLVIASGKLAGTYRRIMAQTEESGDTVFYLEFALPFLPAPGDTLSAYVSLPLDLATSLALGIPFAGFPYVPNPLDSSILV